MPHQFLEKTDSGKEFDDNKYLRELISFENEIGRLSTSGSAAASDTESNESFTSSNEFGQHKVGNDSFGAPIAETDRQDVEDILSKLDRMYGANGDMTNENHIQLERLRKFGVHLHYVRPDDTVQRLAVLYGVEVSNLLRKNRLWTNDSIHSRKYIIIPNQTTFASFPSSPDNLRDTSHSSNCSNISHETPQSGSEKRSISNLNSVSSKLQEIDQSVVCAISSLEKQGVTNIRPKFASAFISPPKSSQSPSSSTEFLSTEIPPSLSHYFSNHVTSQPPPLPSPHDQQSTVPCTPPNINLNEVDSTAICTLSSPLINLTSAIARNLNFDNPKYRYKKYYPTSPSSARTSPSTTSVSKATNYLQKRYNAIEKIVLKWVLNSSPSSSSHFYPSANGSSTSTPNDHNDERRYSSDSDSSSLFLRRVKANATVPTGFGNELPTADLLNLGLGTDTVAELILDVNQRRQQHEFNSSLNSSPVSSPMRRKNKELLDSYYRQTDLIEFDSGPSEVVSIATAKSSGNRYNSLRNMDEGLDCGDDGGCMKEIDVELMELRLRKGKRGLEME